MQRYAAELTLVAFAYRSRYDAARTVDGSSERLRDGVELDALRGDLLTVVGDTMQLAHASLWLRR